MNIINLFDLDKGFIQKRPNYEDRESVVGIPRMALGVIGIFSNISISSNRTIANGAINASTRMRTELEEDLLLMHGVDVSTEVNRTITIENAYTVNNISVGQPVYISDSGTITASTTTTNNSVGYVMGIDTGVTCDSIQYYDLRINVTS